MPRDITVTFQDGSTHTYQGAPDGITPEQVTERASKEFGQGVVSLDGGRSKMAPGPTAGLAETAKVADKIVRGGATSLPGFMGDVGLAGLKHGSAQLNENPIGSAGMINLIPQLIAKINGPAAQDSKFGDVTKMIQTLGGLLPELSKPETEVGKAVGNVGEAAVSTMLGGGANSMASKAITGTAAGAGGEAAARVFGDNALTRGLGGLAGGGAASLIQSNVPNAENLMRTAT